MKESGVAAGKALKWVLWAACPVVLAALSGCARETLLPTPPILEDWDYLEMPQTYNRENLYDYMNGKARAYLDYGFVRLDHAQLARRGQPVSSPGTGASIAAGLARSVVDVDVYDMGSPAGAFGIYALERGEDLPLHYRKRLGYMVGSARFFWKGRHYVTVTSADGSPGTIDAINAISTQLERSVPVDSEGVPLLAAFPAEGKVPESEQYFAINLMGHEFMGGGFTARYSERGNRFRLFLSAKESPTAAKSAYQKLRSELSENGKFTGEFRGIGESVFQAQDNYLGNWLVSSSGSYVLGVAGFQDDALARKLLIQLALNLRHSAPSVRKVERQVAAIGPGKPSAP
jgi:hypothetical protein